MIRQFFLIEGGYALAIFALCMCVYLITREVYSLSQHKGIFFFRFTFLFFGLSYLARATQVIAHMEQIKSPVFMLISLYLSTIAITSMFVTNHKTLREKNWIISAMYLFSFFITMMALVNPLLVLIAQSTLLVAAVILTFTQGFSLNKATYLLIMLFWIINIISIPRGPIHQDSRLLLYMGSITIFFYILVRVFLKIYHGKKKK